jgi:hypothetical protein
MQSSTCLSTLKKEKEQTQRRSICAKEVEDIPTTLLHCITAITAIKRSILLREPMSLLTPQQSRTKVVLLARILTSQDSSGSNHICQGRSFG